MSKAPDAADPTGSSAEPKQPSQTDLLMRVAKTMPLQMVLAKSLSFAWKAATRPLRELVTGRSSPYLDPLAAGTLTPILGNVDFSVAAANAETIRALTSLWLDHRFDLLGSGWVRVAHGETYPGFAGNQYGPGPVLPPDWRKAVAASHRPGARAPARALLDCIADPDWRPIDWMVDFRSGYRWSTRDWGRAVSGGQPGLDIKLPWELARFQHAPVLAQAHALAARGIPGFPAPERIAAEFCHQVLDFLGANPPGWGPNWSCPMDVAIRAANLLVAWDLFRAQGVVFEPAFDAALAAAALAHGRFVFRFLEWHETYRANHYLADLCGLAFVAAYLPEAEESKSWLGYAADELEAEILRQFAADGGCFEASIAYHRLSAEMALYTAALLAGRGRPLSVEAQGRLAAALRFAAASTLPSGLMIQIGDTDSGRFFKAAPLCDPGSDGPVERILDPAELFAAGRGLFDHNPLASIPPQAEFATILAAALAGGTRFAETAPPLPVLAERPIFASPAGLVVRIVPPDSTALEGLEPLAFTEFGLYLWRGPRALIAVRCGPIGQNGRGGHAHNDQLAVEIEIDGVAWARDPGSYVFGSDLLARDRYRSALAHFVPRHGDAEPAEMLAPFRLEDRAQAEAIRFGADFIGTHRGFDEVVTRRVAIEDGAIVIEDRPAEAVTHIVRSPAELAALWGLTLPFSPGYGRRL
ncbi:heparinase II/III domain-containing protein [Magnetospirillum fulvum]|uniref:Heparinase II/III N-terminus n=1 Tax=Magnetospirillum fulvum TaxID=1082 RepID=A0A1H6IJX9_MAGFU|nr:heparinase II/III family protein [Magnetospirillum fulvum]SEH49742.1 Heparinase II/III N-terminus [Magnetospirillum fulvum]